MKPRFRSAGLIYDIEIRELIEHAVAFEAELLKVKQSSAPLGLRLVSA
jgi:hypothetical protein